LRVLEQRGFIVAVESERGIAGGDRTIYSPTRAGRAALRKWLRTPVAHGRDVRSEFLAKLELCRLLHIDRAPLIARQRAHFAQMPSVGTDVSDDPVEVWRQESVVAVLRFLDRLESTDAGPVKR
jgi:DNA-binding MarR family transcriptional regulator